MKRSKSLQNTQFRKPTLNNYQNQSDKKLRDMEKHNIEIFENKLENIVRLLNTKKIPNRGWKKSKIGFISGDGENPLKNVVYFDPQNAQNTQKHVCWVF